MTTPLHRSPHPLTFVAAAGTGEPSSAHEGATYRIEVMGLGGFQKEGLAEDVRTGRRWRLVCDEGKYLRGDNMAPAPLAYWIAGLQADITFRITEVARVAGVAFDDLNVAVGQGFGVKGSFAKGQAVAQVYDLRCDVDFVSDHADATVETLVKQALTESSALSALIGPHEGLFALTTNGKETPVDDLAKSRTPQDDPFLRHAHQPAPAETRPDAVPVSHPDADSPPLMLNDDHDGIVRWRIRADGGVDTTTGLFVTRIWFSENVPTWTLLSDPANHAAPAPLVHFAIGTAFCFHTQLCRYVSVRRMPVEAPRLAQLSRFTASGFEPLDTRLFLNGRVSGEEATSLMTAAANTCYAHRALTVPVEHHTSITHGGPR
ncbi:hypothetical protein [Streptomyces sp. NPDC048636]|uniref:hypothetical protein n=1 Tax=Streptomyces sp. NPDC048636 TaxID=3155762 RepID=UPI0034205F63